mmetsp:Transcript_21493/g.54102  ORF Transcript_21493/g.54102 Transcript_21493/m.54102 type:complete len:609 (-) Transcript_21493:210-2036(-)
MSDGVEFSSCPYCGSDDIITDYTEGVVVCRSCGLMLQNKIVSDAAEWRSFKDDPADRVQRAEKVKINPYLSASAQMGNTSMVGKQGSVLGKALFAASLNVAQAATNDAGLARIFSTLRKFVLKTLKRGERSLDECMSIIHGLYSGSGGGGGAGGGTKAATATAGGAVANQEPSKRITSFTEADFILILCVAQIRMKEPVSIRALLDSLQAGNISNQGLQKADIEKSWKRFETSAPFLIQELTKSAASEGGNGNETRKLVAKLVRGVLHGVSSETVEEETLNAYRGMRIFLKGILTGSGIRTGNYSSHSGGGSASGVEHKEGNSNTKADIVAGLLPVTAEAGVGTMTVAQSAAAVLDRLQKLSRDHESCCAAAVYLVAVVAKIVPARASPSVNAVGLGLLADRGHGGQRGALQGTSTEPPTKRQKTDGAAPLGGTTAAATAASKESSASSSPKSSSSSAAGVLSKPSAAHSHTAGATSKTASTMSKGAPIPLATGATTSTRGPPAQSTSTPAASPSDQLATFFPSTNRHTIRDALRLFLTPALEDCSGPKGKGRPLFCHAVSDEFEKASETEHWTGEKLRKVLKRLFPSNEWGYAAGSGSAGGGGGEND